MKKILTTFIVACLCFGINLQAQFFAKENTVELTGKAKKRGYLEGVVTDDANQKFELVFITKEKARKVKQEVYEFDYDFNPLGNRSEVVDLVKVKVKKKKRKKYDGNDVIVVQGVTATSNMMGKLLLKKMEYMYRYNWWKGDYEVKERVLAKQKPTEIAGDGDNKKRKLLYYAHKDISEEGELLVCALVNKGPMQMYKSGEREYLIMHIDKDLNTLKKTPLVFQHPQALLFSKPLEQSDDWVLVFQNSGNSMVKKVKHENSMGITVVRIDGEGNIASQTQLDSKCNEWAIFDIHESGDNLLLYGAGNINKPEKNYTKQPFCIHDDAIISFYETEEARSSSMEESKYGYLQLVGLNGNEVKFVSAVSVDEINEKGRKPGNQKKLKEFNGKKFVLNDVNVTSNGDYFFSGQNIKYDAIGGDKGRVYQDYLMFHFNSNGELKAYYGIKNETVKKGLINGAGGPTSYPAEYTIFESPNNPNKLYWNIMYCADVDMDCETDVTHGVAVTWVKETCLTTPLMQGKIAEINAETGDISDVKQFGDEKFFLYTDITMDGKGNPIPFFTINGGKQLVYMSRERKGGISGVEAWKNHIWFGKLDPTKQ